MQNYKFYTELLNKTLINIAEIKPDDHCQVLNGVLSDALVLMIIGSKLESKELMERSSYLIDYHLQTAEDYILNYKWAHGVTGLVWGLSLLNNNNLIDSEVLGDIEQIDKIIGKSLIHDFELKSYDFTVGCLGKLHYFLERNNNSSNRYLNNIIDFLYDNAFGEKDNEAYWFDYYTIEDTNELVVNLGLFHGHSSIVYFLAKLYKKNINSEKVRKLLSRALNFLERIYLQFDRSLPNKLLYIDGKLFNHTKDNVQGVCHGLISNSLAFYFGGMVLKETKWISLFEEIIINSTSIKPAHIDYNENREPWLYLSEGNGKMNITFCHGIIGNLYMLEKINRILNNEKLSNYINDLEEYLWKISINEGKLIEKHFYHKGILAGKSGLAIFLMQKLGKETSALDKVLLLDFESFICS